MTALTFWHSGGDIIWRGSVRAHPIERRQAEGLRDTYSVEARAAYRVGELEQSKVAARLWVELTTALDAQADWRRACAYSPWPAYVTRAA